MVISRRRHPRLRARWKGIRRLGHRYQQAGLDGAPYEKQRPGGRLALLPWPPTYRADSKSKFLLTDGSGRVTLL